MVVVVMRGDWRGKKSHAGIPIAITIAAIGAKSVDPGGGGKIGIGEIGE